MGTISVGSVWRSEAQLRPKQLRVETTDPTAFAVPSTTSPSSSTSDVTLEVVMAQLECMDAHLDTLTDKLCQVNTRVSRIARRQACLGHFAASPSLFPEASANEDGDDN